MQNTQGSTWIMARKLNNLQNETETLYDLECGRKLNNVENEKRKMYVLEYGQKY
jgi:hypothetical protein